MVGAVGTSRTAVGGVEALDAADGEPAIPLLLDVEVGVLAERLGFARHHHHRYLGLHGAMDAHASLQHSDAGVQQHRLRPPGHQRVAGRHVDGERLMPGFDEDRTGLVVELLPRQGFPDRRPFRAWRGHDVVDLELAEGFEDRLAAVEIILHRHQLPDRAFGAPNTEFQCRARRVAAGFQIRAGRTN
jgi:hypothetical protein